MKLKNRTATKIRWKEFVTLRKRLYQHVYTLSASIGSRSHQEYSALKKTLDYIAEQMALLDNNFSFQPYRHEKKSFNNLIVEKPGQKLADEIIVIGAHYDSVFDSPGADDNATGIACLIELTRLLQNYPNQRTFRFVAFTLEEAPFFGTNLMGSDVYASSCRAKNEHIVGMIALEMLGFYTEKKHSQKYPVATMKDSHFDRGNFIAIVGNEKSQQLADDMDRHIKKHLLIKTRKIVSPPYIPGVSLSDHASFWKYDYPAIMITDTAFYRNPHYHEVSDTIDTLNFKYFTRFVFSLAFALQELDQQESL